MAETAPCRRMSCRAGAATDHPQPYLAQLAERFRRRDVDRDGFLGEELAAPPR